MKKVIGPNILTLFLLIVFISSVVNYSLAQESCKYTFCSCCGQGGKWDVFNLAGINVANIVIDSTGCMSADPANFTSGQSYYVVPHGCGAVSATVYFTACTCGPNYGKPVDTVMVKCCGDNMDHGSLKDPDKTLPPKRFELKQNYPNPFNPTTKIEYDLPKDASVTLTIYDISGKEVQTLVNEYVSAGYHEVTWDAKSYASGVYFYKISAGNYKEERKMMLIK